MKKTGKKMASILAAAALAFGGAKAAKAEQIGGSKVVNKAVRTMGESGTTVEVAETKDGNTYTRTLRAIGNNQYEPTSNWYAVPKQKEAITITDINNVGDEQTSSVLTQLSGTLHIGEEQPVNTSAGVTALRRTDYGFQKVRPDNSVSGCIVQTAQGYQNVDTVIKREWLNDCETNSSTGLFLRAMIKNVPVNGNILIMEKNNTGTYAVKQPFGLREMENGKVTADYVDFRNQFYKVPGALPVLKVLSNFNDKDVQQFLTNCNHALKNDGNMAFAQDETSGQVVKIAREHGKLTISTAVGREQSLIPANGKNGDAGWKILSPLPGNMHGFMMGGRQ